VTGDGYGLDIGLMRQINRKYTLGLLLQDIFTDFSWDSGRNDDIPMTMRIGVGYNSRLNDFKAGFDYIMDQDADSYFSFGAEYSLFSVFCVRAGFNDGDVSYGFGIKYDEWMFDYASQQGEFEDTVTISATMNLKKLKTSIDREVLRYRDGKVIRKAEKVPQDRSSSNTDIPGSDAIKAVLDRYSGKNEEIKEADKKLEFHRKELEIPEEAKMHYKLGNTFLLEEVYTKAIEEYKKAIELYPSYGQAHYNLAALYEKMEFTEKAIYEYQMVIQIDPYNVNSYIALGNLYLSMNNINEAIRFFNKVIIIAPGSKSAELAEQKIKRLNEK
jgi:tetratricopeptide (TPR) repeat protein